MTVLTTFAKNNTRKTSREKTVTNRVLREQEEKGAWEQRSCFCLERGAHQEIMQITFMSHGVFQFKEQLYCHLRRTVKCLRYFVFSNFASKNHMLISTILKSPNTDGKLIGLMHDFVSC